MPRDKFVQIAETLAEQQRSRAHDGVRLRGRLDAAHRRRAVHSHGRDSADAARQHRAARAAASWRCAVTPTSKARPTSRRSTTCCPATCRCPRRIATSRRSRVYLKSATKRTGWWVNTPKYMVSLLKAYYGDAATKENDYCFEYLPQLIGDYSVLPTTDRDEGRQRQRLLRDRAKSGVVGSKRRAGTRRARAARVAGQHRRLRQRRPRLVLAARGRRSARRSGPRCSSSPVRPCSKKTARWSTPTACCSGTTRPSSRPANRKSDLYSFTWLAKRLEEAVCGFDRSQGSADPRYDLGLRARRPARAGARASLRRSRCCKRSTAIVTSRRGEQVAGFHRTQRRRFDRCGRLDLLRRCPDKETNRARNRKGERLDTRSIGAARGRRTGACSTIAPRPIPTASRGANARSTCGGTRARRNGPVPTFRTSPPTKAPNAPAKPGAGGIDAHSGSDPFIMHARRTAQIFVPGGRSKTRRFRRTTNRCSRSCTTSSTRSRTVRSSVASGSRRQCHTTRPIDDRLPVRPHDLSRDRAVGHHDALRAVASRTAAGGCSPRSIRELAVEKGIKSGDWVDDRRRRSARSRRARS